MPAMADEDGIRIVIARPVASGLVLGACLGTVVFTLGGIPISLGLVADLDTVIGVPGA